MPERIHSYAPVWNASSRILVLGTMPSVESLRQGFYYAHPRNAFWRILAELFGETVPESVTDKKRLMLANGVALWDVLASCEREGSLDSAIRREVPNDIPALLAACPNIRRICFNGGTAARLFTRHFGRNIAGVDCVRLPSTSPAYTLSYQDKLTAWRAAIGGEKTC